VTELGEAELQAGHAAESAAHLHEALGLVQSREVRVRAAVAAGSAMMASAGPAAAFELLAAQARIVGGEAALRIDAERVALAMWVRGAMPLPWLDDLLNRFGELRGDTPAERLALTQAAMAAAYDPTEQADRAAALARRALSQGELLSELTIDAVPVGMACYVLVMAEDFGAGHEELVRMRADARDRGSLLGETSNALMAGQIALRRGRLADAAVELEAAVDSARALEDSPISDRCLAFAEAWLLEALLQEGQVAAARTLIGRWCRAGDFDRAELVWNRYGRGLERLLVGEDPGGAAEDFMVFGDAARAGAYEDRGAPWRQWGALALAAAGRGAEALALADEQLAISTPWSQSARGAALRVRALVGDADEAEPLLARAVALMADSPCLLDRAKALVDHGIALRREGLRREARTQLEEGLEFAARCGAAPLIERTRAELLVLGARPRRLMFSGVEGLTASERRVAGMAAEGLSNRDIAQALFVTQKTVETHLRSTYRKLDINSRHDLPAALLEDSAAVA
jgi:DNA-binding CsgD family transcriptional regulator/tetratricopeptide (TPR) repeat protein